MKFTKLLTLIAATVALTTIPTKTTMSHSATTTAIDVSTTATRSVMSQSSYWIYG